MDRWEEHRRRGKASDFCWENYLKENILHQLHQQKSSFAQYLVDLEFLNDSDYKQDHLNVNSNNISLVKAVICSGLYPNVAIVK